MNTAVKSSESADYRRGLGFFLFEIPSTDAPKHLFRPLPPATLISAPSGPTQWLFQGPPAESKFLATYDSDVRKLIIVVRGTDAQSGALNLKNIQEDRRAVAPVVPPTDAQTP
jgi:hypothetical protein